MFGYFKGREVTISIWWAEDILGYSFCVKSLKNPKSIATSLWYIPNEERSLEAETLTMEAGRLGLTYHFNLFRRFWKSRFKRQAERKRRQVQLFKEELMAVAWHPRRVQALIEADRWDLIDS